MILKHFSSWWMSYLEWLIEVNSNHFRLCNRLVDIWIQNFGQVNIYKRYRRRVECIRHIVIMRVKFIALTGKTFYLELNPKDTIDWGWIKILCFLFILGKTLLITSNKTWSKIWYNIEKVFHQIWFDLSAMDTTFMMMIHVKIMAFGMRAFFITY